jgi:hypothetical protein
MPNGFDADDRTLSSCPKLLNNLINSSSIAIALGASEVIRLRSTSAQFTLRAPSKLSAVKPTTPPPIINISVERGSSSRGPTTGFVKATVSSSVKTELGTFEVGVDIDG